MPVRSAVPLELTAAERPRLKKMAYGHKTRTRHASGRRSCSWQHEAAATRRSPLKSTCTWTPCAAGAADSRPAGWPPWPTASGRGGLRRSPRCRSPKSMRWPAQLPTEFRSPALVLVMPRARTRGRHPGYHRHDLRLHSAPLAQGRRTQALAAPFLDLHPRPELPRHRSTGSWTSTRDVCRRSAGNGRSSSSTTRC